MRAFAIFPLLLALGCSRALAPAFDAVVLGTAGGLEEEDLTSVLVAARGGRSYALLDAGSVRAGVVRAQERGTLFRPDATDAASSVDVFIARHIRAVLVSHAHLDHLAGLVVNSTEDAPKPLLGTPTTLAMVRDHLFNWKLWPNFTDAGVRPLGRYALTPVGPAPTPVAGTPFAVEALPLSHGPGYASTAFLLFAGDDALLYLGDTGPDDVEGGSALAAVWSRVAPLVRERRLHAVFVECSYSDARADAELFGHLNPRWLAKELSRLAAAAGDARALAGLPVVVLHVKPTVEGGTPSREVVRRQLEAGNEVDVKLVFPRQGDALAL